MSLSFVGLVNGEFVKDWLNVTCNSSNKKMLFMKNCNNDDMNNDLLPQKKCVLLGGLILGELIDTLFIDLWMLRSKISDFVMEHKFTGKVCVKVSDEKLFDFLYENVSNTGLRFKQIFTKQLSRQCRFNYSQLECKMVLGTRDTNIGIRIFTKQTDDREIDENDEEYLPPKKKQKLITM